MQNASWSPPPMLLAALLCLPMGCIIASKGDTCEIKTNGISMKARVLDDGSTVRASVVLEAGDMSGVGTKLEVGECDELTINGQGPNMKEGSQEIEYSVTWDLADAPTEYTFRFNRLDDGDDLEATVSLPPQFGVTAPTSGADVSRAAEVELTWDPPAPGGDIEIELEEEIDGDVCLRDWDDVVEDTGTYTIAANTIELSGSDDPEEKTCGAFFVLTRAQSGSYPSELKGGGSTRAEVVRSIDFTSVM